ncbi:unnamed protein product [Arabidopsis halleri]
MVSSRSSTTNLVLAVAAEVYGRRWVSLLSWWLTAGSSGSCWLAWGIGFCSLD